MGLEGSPGQHNERESHLWCLITYGSSKAFGIWIIVVLNCMRVEQFTSVISIVSCFLNPKWKVVLIQSLNREQELRNSASSSYLVIQTWDIRRMEGKRL